MNSKGQSKTVLVPSGSKHTKQKLKGGNMKVI